MGSMKQAVEIDYTNWRGERAMRRIVPLDISWDGNEWHPKTQWLLSALDVDKQQIRTFAMSGIHSWKTAVVDDKRAGEKS